MSTSDYLKKLEEIKKRANGTSMEDKSTNKGSNSSSLSALERVKARANGTYDGGITLPPVNSWFKGVAETSQNNSD